MTAIVLNKREDVFGFPKETVPALGEAGEYINREVKNALDEKFFIAPRVADIFRRHDNYVSEPFLLRHTRSLGFPDEKVLSLIKNDNGYKKSLLKTKNGHSVYYRNRRFGLIVECWKFFRHINALKY